MGTLAMICAVGLVVLGTGQLLVISRALGTVERASEDSREARRDTARAESALYQLRQRYEAVIGGGPTAVLPAVQRPASAPARPTTAPVTSEQPAARRRREEATTTE